MNNKNRIENNKYNDLMNFLIKLGKAAGAFSGGADSTFLPDNGFKAVRFFGFDFATVDRKGYRSGSFNDFISSDIKSKLK